MLFLLMPLLTLAWPPVKISTTISPFDNWWFAGTNTYFNEFNIGGTTGTNGAITWNGIRYTEPWGGSGDGLNLIGEWYGGIPMNISNVFKLYVNKNSGLFISNVPPDGALLTLGSYWHTLTLDDGNSYTPEGEQPLKILVNPDPTIKGTSLYKPPGSDPWIEGAEPWTLWIPSSVSDISIVETVTGPAGSLANVTNISEDPREVELKFTIPQGLRGVQGPRGADGNTFGIYAGAWELGREYTNSSWVTYGLGTYGLVLTNKPGNVWTPTSGTPTNYILSGEVVLLSQSGKDGLSGGSLTPRGTWVSTNIYPQYSLVRWGDKLWYNMTGESVGEDPIIFSNDVWRVFLMDGADGSNGLNGVQTILSSNVLWEGRFTNTATYNSNSIVFLDVTNYGTYFVHTFATPDEYMPQGLNNTNYFTKIAHFGKDGTPGTPGTHGLDGVGNMWFEDYYDKNKVYSNKGVVVVYEGGTWISKIDQAFSNIPPGTNSTSSIYWWQGAKPGTDGADGATGGNYKFIKGWSSGIYEQYDVVIVSNKFYLCNQEVSGDVPPWILGEPTWTILTDPEFREYALLNTTAWDPFAYYEFNQVVRHSNSTWVCIFPTGISGSEPSINSSDWAVLALEGATGPIGPTGETSRITILNPSITGDPGSDAFVDTTGSDEHHAKLRFSIPRGYDGVNLIPYGNWKSDYPYPQYAMVKRGTNAYFTTNSTGSIGQDPLTNSIIWEYFLSDGSRGPQGVAATITAGNTYTLDYGNPASVSNRGNTTAAIFDFRIPEGRQGEPGANLFPYGQWTNNFDYPQYSLVRRFTNLYYTTNSSSFNQDPLTNSLVWKFFISDGPPGLPGSASNATLLVYKGIDLNLRWGLDTNTFFTNSIGIRAKNALTAPLEVKGLSSPLGSYTNGAIIDENTDVELILKNILQKRILPSYTVPTIVLNTESSTYNYEIGTIIFPIINTIFITNTAGALTNYKLYKNNSTIVNESSIISHSEAPFILGTTVSYSSRVTYAQGSLLYDNFGDPYPHPNASPNPAGGYPAGSIVSTPKVYSPRRAYWAAYDTSTNLVTNSDEVRELSQKSLITSETLSFTMNIAAGSRRVIIAYPASMNPINRIIYVQGSSADVKDTFDITTFSVEGASIGFSTLYRVYTYIPKIPFSSIATYIVTIEE
jgi:hypothetical protein